MLVSEILFLVFVSRLYVLNSPLQVLLVKSIYFEIFAGGGTFFVSFNGVVQCPKDTSGHVLHARTDRDACVSDARYTVSDWTLSFHRVHRVFIEKLTCLRSRVGLRLPDFTASSHCPFHVYCMDA